MTEAANIRAGTRNDGAVCDVRGTAPYQLAMRSAGGPSGRA
jgi:hypothetical protein